MRVTHQMLSLRAIENLQLAHRRLAETQEQMSTGRRINRLSDDPIAAMRVMSFRSFEASLQQYEKNINNALPALEQADSALDNIIDRLVRAKELAIAMANDTNPAEQRLQTAVEVSQVVQEVVNIANTRVGDRFIFAGFANGTPPFTQGAGLVTYSGDSGQIFIQTSAASSVAINIPGDQVFQGLGIGGVDIFDVLLDLETALRANDLNGADGIRTQIGRFDLAINQVLSFRAEIGARVNQAQTAKDAIGVINLQTIEQRSRLEDADVLKVYSEFTRYQQALQAALQSAAQVTQPSLLDFLR